jgi:hypothetical protein
MDIADTIEANSDQVNAEDLLAGPVTVRITSVERGSKEQPVFIHTDVFEGRTYRPAKSMRRILVAAWGPEAANYVGRQITIYTDPTVKWAGQEVGGIRISALSHIDKPLTVALTVSRGKRAPFTVQPLSAADDWITAFNEAETVAQLQAAWKGALEARVTSDARVVDAKDKRKRELTEASGERTERGEQQ